MNSNQTYRDSLQRVASRNVSTHETNLAIWDFLRHLLVDRLDPFFTKVGISLSDAELKAVRTFLKEWIKEWNMIDKTFASNQEKVNLFLAKAREGFKLRLNSEKADVMFDWAAKHWPFLSGYPGQEMWRQILYGLTYFDETNTQLPSSMRKKAPFRSRLEQAFMVFESELHSFSETLSAHFEKAGPLSDWETYLVDNCDMKQHFTNGARLADLFEHQAFCRLWYKIRTESKNEEVAVLISWAKKEADSLYYPSKNLELIFFLCTDTNDSNKIKR